MKYTVIIEQGHESGYVAYAPALKGGQVSISNAEREIILCCEETIPLLRWWCQADLSVEDFIKLMK